MEVIRDEKLAVLVSPGYGAGWSSWNTDHPDCLFNPTIVQWVLNGKNGDVPEVCGEDFYYGGARDLVVHWVPVGTKFKIDEYDGNESILYEQDIQWMVA